VVDNDDAVAREVDVELDAVGAEAKTVIEGEKCILRPQRRSAAVRKYEGHNPVNIA